MVNKNIGGDPQFKARQGDLEILRLEFVGLKFTANGVCHTNSAEMFVSESATKISGQFDQDIFCDADETSEESFT